MRLYLLLYAIALTLALLGCLIPAFVCALAAHVLPHRSFFSIRPIARIYGAR